MNKTKNIVTIIPVIFLFLAILGGWPYGLYTLLRLVVCGTTAYLSWLAYESGKQPWLWIFGFIALIFNPLIPLHLGRDLWVVVDLLVVVFWLFLFLFSNYPKNLRSNSVGQHRRIKDVMRKLTDQ